MAVNDNIIALIEDVIDNIRNVGTIISETLNGDILTLELTDLYDLAEGDYIEINSILYQVLDVDSGNSEIQIQSSSVLGETIYKIPKPYFFSGTQQMINKAQAGISDALKKYPCVLVVDIFRTKRVTNPTSPYSREPNLVIAFLDQSSVDYDADGQNPIIDEMNDLAEQFVTELQANQFVGRFDEFDITRHANFGVFATNRGHTAAILDHELSGVVLEITPPIFCAFEGCAGDIPTTIKCAPVLIKDSLGNLITTVQAGGTYTLP